MSNSLSYYATILGVAENATAKAIRTAYRNKVKQVHPDNNSSLKAHEEFILLTEAYEYLLQLNQVKQQKGSAVAFNQAWSSSYQAIAQQQAEEFATAAYDDFIQSAYFNDFARLDEVADSISLGIAWLYILVPAFIGALLHGWSGLKFGFYCTLMLSPWWSIAFASYKENTIDKTQTRFRSLLSHKTIYIVGSILFNLTALIKVSGNTLVPFNYKLLLLMGCSGICYLLYFFVKKNWTKVTLSFMLICGAPTLFNTLFIVNHINSTPLRSEHYMFNTADSSYKYTQYSPFDIKKSQIVLEKNAYAEYRWIRFYFDYNQLAYKNVVTYHFNQGCLGWKYLTSSKFSFIYRDSTLQYLNTTIQQ